MSLTIRAENLKALKKFEWSPSGVCALVGPNGAGKSTALRIIHMLRRSLESGYDEGLRVFGTGPLRNLDSPEGSQPKVSLEYGDLNWTLVLERTDAPSEQATRGGVAVFPRARAPDKENWFRSTSDVLTPVKTVANQLLLGQMSPVIDVGAANVARLIRASRYFSRPDLSSLRDEGSTSTNDTSLDSQSKNLFAVLRNWRDRSEHEFRQEFVLNELSQLLPGFRRLDFENWGPRIGAALPVPGSEQKLPPSDWSDGFLTALCHLTAVASVGQGIVAIDEPENSLHPELIVRLIEAMREWSRQRGVTIVLATHSPVVLDQFRDEPEKVFVMQPGHDQQPVPLDQLKKRDWLQHYSLGDLYSHLEVGASGQ